MCFCNNLDSFYALSSEIFEFDSHKSLYTAIIYIKKHSYSITFYCSCGDTPAKCATSNIGYKFKFKCRKINQGPTWQRLVLKVGSWLFEWKYHRNVQKSRSFLYCTMLFDVYFFVNNCYLYQIRINKCYIRTSDWNCQLYWVTPPRICMCYSL